MLSITSKPLQAKQLIRSTTSVFFIGWEMQYDKNGHSYGQLVIGSFIVTMYLLMYLILGRVSWWNIKSPRWLSPLQTQIWCPATSGFSPTKNTFEREEISDCRWDLWKYDRAAGGDSNKGFCRAFWMVEEMLGELCEVPRCLLWRGLRCHCAIYNVSCILYLLQ